MTIKPATPMLASTLLHSFYLRVSFDVWFWKNRPKSCIPVCSLWSELVQAQSVSPFVDNFLEACRQSDTLFKPSSYSSSSQSCLFSDAAKSRNRVLFSPDLPWKKTPCSPLGGRIWPFEVGSDTAKCHGDVAAAAAAAILRFVEEMFCRFFSCRRK